MYSHSMYSMFYFFFQTIKFRDLGVNFVSKVDFSNGFCNDQRDAAVVILRYTTLSHNGFRSDTHISFWQNLKRSVRL